MHGNLSRGCPTSGNKRGEFRNRTSVCATEYQDVYKVHAFRFKWRNYIEMSFSVLAVNGIINFEYDVGLIFDCTGIGRMQRDLMMRWYFE